MIPGSRYDWGGTNSNPFYDPTQLPLHTPHIDGLAARVVRFPRAFVPTLVCAPSRTCLASGREYNASGQGANARSRALNRDGDFDVESIPTFYQALQQQGYHTMIAGRDDLTKQIGPGLNGNRMGATTLQS